MEFSARSLHHNQRLSNVISTKHHEFTKTVYHPCSILPLSPLYFRSLHSRARAMHYTRTTPSSSIPIPQSNDASQKLAIFLEVEGVLIDAYRLENRQAFNIAFQKLGLDCANWTEPIYLDLLRNSSGDEERILLLYFNQIGWPSSLPTSEKGAFVKSVLQEKKNALDEFVLTKSLPLRPGVEDFIDNACNEGIPVALLTAYSKSGDAIARSITEKLGNERLSKLRIIGDREVEQSFVGKLILKQGLPTNLGSELAKDIQKAVFSNKHIIAEEVASMLNQSVDIGMSSGESLQKMVALLRAGAELVDFPIINCVLITASPSGAAGAQLIGMPYFILRTSSTTRLEFSSSNAVMDGFGGADLTISKILEKRWS